MANKRNGKGPIIAVAVLLVVLVLAVAYLSLAGHSASHSTSTGSSCTAQQDFTCQSASYSYSNGNITLFVAQNTGSNWSVATIIFVPGDAQYSGGVPVVSWSNGTVINGGLAVGKTVMAELRVPGGKIPVGSTVSGDIWAQYQLNAGGTFYYVKMATVHAASV